MSAQDAETSPTSTESVPAQVEAQPVPERPTGSDLSFGMDRWGERMAEQGVTVEASVTADYSVVLDGGVDDGADAFRHLTAVGVTLDTERLFEHPGGTIFADFVTKNGQDGSEEVGDFQAFSNIDEADFTTIYEVWYQQEFFDGRLRLKLGKVDVNNEFAFVENAGEFINSSAGFSPTIFVLPTYPDPALGASVSAYDDSGVYASAGVYDGAAQEGFATGQRGFSTLFGEPSDLFLIGEFGVAHEASFGPGRVAVGIWHHTGTFDRFDGGQESGTTGGYFVLDQTVYQTNPGDPDDARGIGVFAQYGWADGAVSEAEHHASLGGQWFGPLPDRPDDVLGLMVSPVWFSDEPGAGFTEDAEWAFEAFVKFQVTPWLSIKPDLQYIIHPGGDATVDDALVGTLRLELAF
ncbi:MAG: carbohydrate porin [Planctomycetota bacterium]